MYKQKLESILKEEWLKAHDWHTLDLPNQKRFHEAIRRVYKELESTPTNDDFLCIVNNVISDPTKSKDIEIFAKKAEIMFNYYRVIN